MTPHRVVLIVGLVAIAWLVSGVLPVNMSPVLWAVVLGCSLGLSYWRYRWTTSQEGA